MKKIITGMCFLLIASASYASEYNCTISYGEESQSGVPVIKDNQNSKMGTMLQLNASQKLAFISIKSTVNPNIQDVSLYFAAPDATGISSSDDSITTITANNQKSILLTGQFSGKSGSLSCELK